MSAIPVSGEPVPALAAVDRFAETWLGAHPVPGVAIAIVHAGRIVYARGFGWADQTAGSPVAPESLFRIMSVSKPITAVAIPRLMEQGRLSVADPIETWFPEDPFLEPVASADPRWAAITVADLLRHSGGFDRDVSWDPPFATPRVAAAMGVPLPVAIEDVIRYLRGQPLDFEPGTRFACSNIGYAILGRIIERVTGEGYEPWVCREILHPLGIKRARIGGSLRDERIPGEVAYGTGMEVPAVVGPMAGRGDVELAYGGFDFRVIDAHGGWVMSAPDMARFGAAFDIVGDETRGGLLPAQTARLMFEPHIVTAIGEDGRPGGHFGYGWTVKDSADGPVCFHNGTLHCTAAILMRFPRRYQHRTPRQSRPRPSGWVSGPSTGTLPPR